MPWTEKHEFTQAFLLGVAFGSTYITNLTRIYYTFSSTVARTSLSTATEL